MRLADCRALQCLFHVANTAMQIRYSFCHVLAAFNVHSTVSDSRACRVLVALQRRDHCRFSAIGLQA